MQSHWFSVGPVVPWAEPGVGVVATQSLVDISYGPLGLDLMRGGKAAEETLKALLAADHNAAVRQVAMLDAAGNVAAHTGEKCIPEAGHIVGKHYSVQANLMLNDEVWPAMAGAFERAEGRLSDRMLLALEAAQKVGGDIRGQQSAAILVVKEKSEGGKWTGRVMDLRVEDSPDPLKELRRLVRLHEAYERMNKGDKAMETSDVETALPEYAMAERLYPENPEMRFWHAVSLANANRAEEAIPIFRSVFSQDSNWEKLLPRLRKVELLRIEESLLKRILTEAG